MSSDAPNNDDRVLLHRFVQDRDEQSFRRLVEKFTDLVYGVALRRTGNAEMAEEISQDTFLALARKAASIRNHPSLAAWLHRVASLESLRALRSESRRKRHVAMIEESHKEAPVESKNWHEIRPLIDQLLNRLSTSDQAILIAHFLEGYSFSEISKRMGLTPAATQKRSVRALDKLSRLLKKRGLVTTGTILASALATESTHAAPIGMAQKIGLQTISANSAALPSSTTIITAMTSKNLTLTGAFIIAALIPISGKMALSSNQSKSNSLEQSPLSPSQSTRDHDKKNHGFNSAKFRTALEQLLSQESDDPALSRDLQRLIFSLDGQEIQEALAILDSFEKDNRLLDLVTATFARWAELDPTAAVAEAHSRPKSQWGYYPISGAWNTWAFSDWKAARDWELAHHDSFHLWSYLETQAKLNGPLAITHALELGRDDETDREAYFQRALSTWTSHKPEDALIWIRDNLNDPLQRDKLGGEALEKLGESQPALALSKISLIENPARLREVRYNIMWTWSLLQPREAAHHFTSTKAGEVWHPDTLRHFGEAIARNEPRLGLELAREIVDPKRRDQMYCGILGGARASDLSLVREAADALSAESARTNDSLGGFLRHWASHDREAAFSWVESLPEGQKKDDARHFFPRNHAE